MDLLMLGSKIKTERRHRKITLEKLSEQIGISRNFLWEIEAGRKAPALNTLYNIAVALNISIDYLMGVSDENKHIDNKSLLTERDVQVSMLLKQLSEYNSKELMLISNLLSEFTRYMKK